MALKEADRRTDVTLDDNRHLPNLAEAKKSCGMVITANEINDTIFSSLSRLLHVRVKQAEHKVDIL